MTSLCEVIPCLSHIMKCSPDGCAIGADELAAGVSSVSGVDDAGGGDSGIVVDKELSPSAAAEGGSILIIVNRSSITSDLLDVSRGANGRHVELERAALLQAEQKRDV